MEPRRFDKRSDRPELGESLGDARSIVVEPYRRLRSHAGSGLPAHNVARSPEASSEDRGRVLEVAREREGFTGQFPVVANRPPPRDKDDKDDDKDKDE